MPSEPAANLQVRAVTNFWYIKEICLKDCRFIAEALFTPIQDGPKRGRRGQWAGFCLSSQPLNSPITTSEETETPQGLPKFPDAQASASEPAAASEVDIIRYYVNSECVFTWELILFLYRVFPLQEKDSGPGFAYRLNNCTRQKWPLGKHRPPKTRPGPPPQLQLWPLRLPSSYYKIFWKQELFTLKLPFVSTKGSMRMRANNSQPLPNFFTSLFVTSGISNQVNMLSFSRLKIHLLLMPGKNRPSLRSATIATINEPITTSKPITEPSCFCRRSIWWFPSSSKKVLSHFPGNTYERVHHSTLDWGTAATPSKAWQPKEHHFPIHLPKEQLGRAEVKEQLQIQTDNSASGPGNSSATIPSGKFQFGWPKYLSGTIGM